MNNSIETKPTVARSLLRLLEHYGVDTVFGLPGVHTVELYRSLPETAIRHVTPRHEQGAAFMADGYARSSGRPGVCLLITGPGVTNAVTAIAQAYADSVPVLVVSSVNPINPDGPGEGRLHELPDQQGLMAKCTAASITVSTPDELAPAMARAFAIFSSARPRPVHIEIPIDVMPAALDVSTPSSAPFVCPEPEPGLVDDAVQRLRSSTSPLIIAGGGARHAGPELQQLVERLGAVYHHTIAAKGVLAFDHPANAGGTLGFDPAREQVRTADLVFAVGTELAPTDLWPYESIETAGDVIRIDIEARQFEFGPRAVVNLHGDAKRTLAAINDALATAQHQPRTDGSTRASVVREATEFSPVFARWLGPLREALADDTVFTADSTQIVYDANASFPMRTHSSWLTSVTGYGTLGYALPAALGARLALPGRRVVCIAGDGGFQFTSQELMTAADNNIAVDILIWNNSGYGEIRDSMNSRGVAPEGVDVAAPDFQLLARACGVPSSRVTTPEELVRAIQQSPEGPRLIEMIDSA